MHVAWAPSNPCLLAQLPTWVVQMVSSWMGRALDTLYSPMPWTHLLNEAWNPFVGKHSFFPYWRMRLKLQTLQGGEPQGLTCAWRCWRWVSTPFCGAGFLRGARRFSLCFDRGRGQCVWRSAERLAEMENVYQVSLFTLKFPAKAGLYLSVYPHL